MSELPQRGGSNEYPQSMLWIKNKENRYTPANPSFSYIKLGFEGLYISGTCFRVEICQNLVLTGGVKLHPVLVILS